jgi:hypothetical protein
VDQTDAALRRPATRPGLPLSIPSTPMRATVALPIIASRW